mmetsp:Transcript_17959/g.53384  ORF Transcript_17959/g.53384 Transcript_17959/m.53384 type:complete len:103 (-) Transcript_17959:12-320(-)
MILHSWTSPDVAGDDDEGVAVSCGGFCEGVLLLGGHRCDLCGTSLDESGRCAQRAVLSFAAAAVLLAFCQQRQRAYGVYFRVLLARITPAALLRSSGKNNII